MHARSQICLSYIRKIDSNDTAAIAGQHWFCDVPMYKNRVLMKIKFDFDGIFHITLTY